MEAVGRYSLNALKSRTDSVWVDEFFISPKLGLDKNHDKKDIMESKLEAIAKEVANLVVEKDKSYGNAVGQAKEFLKLLYPDGVPIESYPDMLTLVRIWDKIKRIATDKEAFGEDPYKDIIGYCLLRLKDET